MLGVNTFEDKKKGKEENFVVISILYTRESLYNAELYKEQRLFVVINNSNNFYFVIKKSYNHWSLHKWTRIHNIQVHKMLNKVKYVIFSH